MEVLPKLQASSDIVRRAVDAFCLAHVASYTGNDTLSQHAKTCHGSTLAALSREMEKRQHRPLDVVLAIFLTVIFPESMPVAPLEQRAWVAHTRGLVQYSAVCGPAAFDMANYLDKRTFESIHETAFYLGLAQRKPTGAEKLNWTQPYAFSDKNARSPHGVASKETLYRHAQRLPAVLQGVDKVLEEDCDQLEVQRVIARIEGLRHNLDYWFRWQSGFKGQQPGTMTVQDRYTDDDNAIRCAIVNSSVFSECYEFPNRKVSFLYMTYSMCALLLDVTHLHLAHFLPAGSFAAFKTEQALQRVEESASAHATSLCKSMYSISETESLAYTQFMTLLLELALNYFTEAHSIAEMGWCQSVICAVRLHADMLEAVQPPSLCRLGEVMPWITCCGHYRARNPHYFATEESVEDTFDTH